MSKTIYKNTPELTSDVFQNPPAEYRGAPFWSWNGDLKEELLAEQIDTFKEMGMGGAHMHVRTGLSLPYLGKEHLDRVRFCTEKFKKEGMLSWLYDEDRYPSGAAGGLVTKDPKYRGKSMQLTPERWEENDFIRLRACYDIVLDEAGYLRSYDRVDPDTATPKGTLWYAYFYTDHIPNPWFNNQSYVSTLDPEALGAFLRTTYETYREAVGDEFGKTIPAIFCDEPQKNIHQFPLAFAHEKKKQVLPWTPFLTDEYQKLYDADIMEHLPEMFWELPDGQVSVHRYQLHDLMTELFVRAFSDQCGKWCDDHGIMLTGHVMGESLLMHQTFAVGETMRSYRGFGLPGIDILRDRREFATAKQCQSAVHQYDRCGMLSELYGVTNWDYDFRGHKLQGDWQAALGVTTRVHHLSYYTMEGEAKRDYPASIGYQSAWHEKYRYIEDHFARVNTAMTRGKAQVRIGMIHPIESCWLHYGPTDQNSAICNQMEQRFQNALEWMLFGLIDFDYISESLLPEQCPVGGNPLSVGAMQYDVILVPACETLRSTTLERLEAFRQAGGRLIFMGEAPTLCDARVSERGRTLYNQSEVIPFDRIELMRALESERSLSMIDEKGNASDDLIYQLRREEKGTQWLFIAHGRPCENNDVPKKETYTLRISGSFKPTWYHTLDGSITEIPYRLEQGQTILTLTVYDHDSFLFRLDPTTDSVGKPELEEREATVHPVSFPWKNDYTLSEDNVYVLDMARYALNEEPLSDEEEEILRLDTACRQKLQWTPMFGEMVQPWVIPESPIENYVHLRFTIPSEIEFTADLAIEQADQVQITLNGERVTATPRGYFADHAIERIPLPPFKKGENVLDVTCPIGLRTSVEIAFLLGQFGVRVVGREKVVTHLPKQLCFDDLQKQGLPFYGANVTYHCPVQVPEDGTLVLHAPVYRGALMSVSIDGEEVGNMVFSPYEVKIPHVTAGAHRIDITLYGTRFNSFGQLHYRHPLDLRQSWYGPTSYRSSDDLWTYEYETKPMGILATPTCTLLSGVSEEMR